MSAAMRDGIVTVRIDVAAALDDGTLDEVNTVAIVARLDARFPDHSPVAEIPDPARRNHLAVAAELSGARPRTADGGPCRVILPSGRPCPPRSGRPEPRDAAPIDSGAAWLEARFDPVCGQAGQAPFAIVVARRFL